MKLITLFAGSAFSQCRKLIVLCIILNGLMLPVHAQVAKARPSWWFGIAGGANYNRYHGYTSTLNADIHPSAGFDKGHAFGEYVAAVIEYHKPGTVWGIMLQQGADNRNGKFENGGTRLDAKITYYTVEPSLVIMIPKTGFHIYAGPRFGFLWGSKFKYQEPNKTSYPQEGTDQEAYIRNLKKNPIAMQVGLGYDLMLNQGSAKTQFILSPFVTFLPSLNENLRTIEMLRLNSFRAGIVFKAGCVSKND